MNTDTFTGFPHGTSTFLTDLAANNNKPWFEAHRRDYEQNLLEPSRAFGDAMADRLTEFAPPGLGDLQGSAFRIYRDVRFSKDKTPYKTHLGVAFNAAGSPKGESPGYYFHLEPPRMMLGAGMHAFPKEFLAAYREAVADDRLGSRLRSAIDDAAVAGNEIWGESYKRVPAGYDPTHPRADLLRYGGLFVAVTEDIPDALHSPALVDYCASRYATMGPILAWLLEMSATQQLEAEHVCDKCAHLSAVEPSREHGHAPAATVDGVGDRRGQ